MAHFGSTTTPLGANGTITVGPIQTDTAQNIAGSVFSDKAGTLFIEQTFDGINFDISVSQAVAANTPASFSQAIIAPVVQLRYVNGGVAQTAFRLYSRSFTTGR